MPLPVVVVDLDVSANFNLDIFISGITGEEGITGMS